MIREHNNYAFIDGQNLNLAIQELGWKLDFKKFRVYLREKYGVSKAYYFIGFVEGNNDLYASLQSDGYVLIFKPTSRIKDGRIKGNCDAELVLQAMIDLDKYQQAVIVTGDGDFACLVKYLNREDKLRCVLAPDINNCSWLLREAVRDSARKRMAFMNGLQNKLEYKKKRAP